MSTLSKDFNVGAVQSGHYQRLDVTLTWDSEIPMEFRLHMWQPTKDGEGITVIWSISRELLIEVTSKHAGTYGRGDVTATRIQSAAAGLNIVRLWLGCDVNDRAQLAFPAEPLTAFVRSSLAMCPTESEAVDVDGLITQIFHAEEAQ